MFSRKMSLALAGAAFCLLGASSSQAAVLTFTIWSGPNDGSHSSDVAQVANTPGAGHVDATFTYNTGPGLSLTFDNPAPQNHTSTGDLFRTFFNSGSGTISIGSFSSPDGAYGSLNQFLNANMSVAGNGNVTFMAITGSFNFGAGSTVSLTHDDGASFYETNGLGIRSQKVISTVHTSAPETVAVTDTFKVSGQQNFLLDYVAGNGSPSVLELSVAAVPEPSTWAMMILGFFGVGFMAYRKKTSLRFI